MIQSPYNLSGIIRYGDGMFTYAPVGFNNTYSTTGILLGSQKVNVQNEILARDIFDRDKTIAPNLTYFHRMMTWLNQEAESHKWFDISGEFNYEPISGQPYDGMLLTESGFIFKTAYDSSGLYNYNPKTYNDTPINFFMTESGVFSYKEISGIPQKTRSHFSDKNFINQLNDIYYSISRRIKTKFNEYDNEDQWERIYHSDNTSSGPYYIRELDISGKTYPHISGLKNAAAEAKPWLFTNEASKNIQLGFTRFFPKRNFESFEYIPANRHGGASNSKLIKHDLVQCGNKGIKPSIQIGLLEGIILSPDSSNITTDNHGILGNQELGGVWPGLNIVPSQKINYYIPSNSGLLTLEPEKTIQNFTIKNFKDEIFNSSYQCMLSGLLNYDKNIIENTFLNQEISPQSIPAISNDSVSSVFFLRNSFGMRTNFGTRLMNNTGRIDQPFYADIQIHNGTSCDLYNFMPLYYTYVGKGTLRNKFGITGEDIKCISHDFLEHYSNTVQNINNILKSTEPIKFIFGRCLTKEEIENHPLYIQLETTSGIINYDISNIVEEAVSGQFTLLKEEYTKARQLIIGDAILRDIREKKYITLGEFTPEKLFAGKDKNYRLDFTGDFNVVNDYKTSGEIIYLSFLSNNGESLLLPEINTLFNTNYEILTNPYINSLDDMKERTKWNNSDMLNIVEADYNIDSLLLPIDAAYRVYYPKDEDFPHVDRFHSRLYFNRFFTDNNIPGLTKQRITSYLSDTNQNITIVEKYSSYIISPLNMRALLKYDGLKLKHGNLILNLSSMSEISPNFTVNANVTSDELENFQIGDAKDVQVEVEFFIDGVFQGIEYHTIKNVRTIFDNFVFNTGDVNKDSLISGDINAGLYQSLGETGESNGFILVDGKPPIGNKGNLVSFERNALENIQIVDFGIFGQVSLYSPDFDYKPHSAKCYSWKKIAQWYDDREVNFVSPTPGSGFIFVPSGFKNSPTDRLVFHYPNYTEKIGDSYYIGDLITESSQPGQNPQNEYDVSYSTNSNLYTQNIGTFSYINDGFGVFNPIYNRAIGEIPVHAPTRIALQGYSYTPLIKVISGEHNYIIHEIEDGGIRSPLHSGDSVYYGFGNINLSGAIQGDIRNDFSPWF